MSIIDPIKQWLFGVALKKAIKAIITLLISWLASVKIAPILASLGITIDPGQLEVTLTAFLTGVLTMFLNWLKLKTGAKFL